MESNRKVLIGGNWKSNGNHQFIQNFDSTLSKITFDKNKCDVMIFPPYVYLQALQKYQNFVVGSQNVSQFNEGAFTGEVTAKQLADIGINHTLIGHSERRALFGEQDEALRAKVLNAEANNLYVVFCLGENLSDREANRTMDVVKQQLSVLKDVKNWGNLAIAYEPVWAIGTGKTATPDQAEEVHSFIRKWLEENISKEVAQRTRIIYGGSVNEKTCDTLIKQPNIDGFLVGGASLKPEFLTIVDSHSKK